MDRCTSHFEEQRSEPLQLCPLDAVFLGDRIDGSVAHQDVEDRLLELLGRGRDPRRELTRRREREEVAWRQAAGLDDRGRCDRQACCWIAEQL